MTQEETRKAWLEARRKGIGGSDIAAILGISPWRSPMDVYLDKIGESPLDSETSEAAHFGNILEEVVAQEFCRRTGNRVMRFSSDPLKNIIHHPIYPWALANLDRVVWEGDTKPVVNGELRTDTLLECKTASAWKSGEWGGEEEDDTIPVEYAAQGMWYLGVTGKKRVFIGALIGGQRFVVKLIERDEVAIEAMFKKAEDFWCNHVLKRIPPPPVHDGDSEKLNPSDDGTSIEADTNSLIAISRIREVQMDADRIEKELSDLKESVKAKMGRAATLTVDGKKLATWKKNADGEKTDWKAAADDIKGWVIEQGIEGGVDEIRDIINFHTKKKTGARVFRVSKA